MDYIARQMVTLPEITSPKRSLKKEQEYSILPMTFRHPGDQFSKQASAEITGIATPITVASAQHEVIAFYKDLLNWKGLLILGVIAALTALILPKIFTAMLLLGFAISMVLLLKSAGGKNTESANDQSAF